MPEELAAAMAGPSKSVVIFGHIIYFGVPIVVGFLLPILVALRSGPPAGKLAAANIRAWAGFLLLLIGPTLALVLLFAKYETRSVAGGILILLGAPVVCALIASLLGYAAVVLMEPRQR